MNSTATATSLTTIRGVTEWNPGGMADPADMWQVSHGQGGDRVQLPHAMTFVSGLSWQNSGPISLANEIWWYLPVLHTAITLDVRDFLRSHSDKAKRYAELI